MFRRTHTCLECGKLVTSKGEFCSTPCRSAFNNRRKQRGAELYDLYMAHRFERDHAQRLGVFQAINRLASNWRQEDHELRNSRKSWRRPSDVLSERPYLKAISTYDGTGRRRRAS